MEQVDGHDRGAPSGSIAEPEARLAPGAGVPVDVLRSPRRRRTGQAAFRDGRIEVRVPAGLAADDEQRLVDRLVSRVVGRHRVQAAGGDAELARRAARLADEYLDGVRPTAVRWSARMTQRHGSCTPSTGEIRVSRRLAALPRYVLDYVLVHELAHLRVSDHSARFQSLLARYPQAERARGFLEGFDEGRLEASRRWEAQPTEGPPPS